MGATPIVCMRGEVTSNYDPSYKKVCRASPPMLSFHNLNYNPMGKSNVSAPKGATKSAKAPIANANLQFFNFKKYERKELQQLGTLNDIFGEDFEIGFSPKNFNSEDNIFLVLDLPNGQSDVISCSKAVSELLRSQELTLGQATNLPVILRELTAGKNAGQMRPMIVLPAQESNQLVKVKANELNKVEFKVNSINRAFNAPAW